MALFSLSKDVMQSSWSRVLVTVSNFFWSCQSGDMQCCIVVHRESGFELPCEDQYIKWSGPDQSCISESIRLLPTTQQDDTEAWSSHFFFFFFFVGQASFAPAWLNKLLIGTVTLSLLPLEGVGWHLDTWAQVRYGFYSIILARDTLCSSGRTWAFTGSDHP